MDYNKRGSTALWKFIELCLLLKLLLLTLKGVNSGYGDGKFLLAVSIFWLFWAYFTLWSSYSLNKINKNS